MSHSLRLTLGTVAAAFVTMFVVTATPQAQSGQFPPAALRNLQVLPKDAPVPAVIDLMKELTRALGVRCDHCHVGTDGRPLPSFDFVSDEKKAKQTTRVMMRMVEQINILLDKNVPGQDGGRVTCFTCHNGRRTPRK
jgi:hypothetical protein